MIEKVVETWHGVVAASCRRRRTVCWRTTSSSIRRSWRNQLMKSSQRSFSNTRGTRPSSKSQIPVQTVRGTRFAVRDKEGAMQERLPAGMTRRRFLLSGAGGSR
jgi:hypothetical protein